MTFQEQLWISLVGATAGGFIGFIFAYRMALIHRRWDLEKAASEAKRSRIEAIQVPLERIRAQIGAQFQLQKFFNSATEIIVLLQIGEAVHALRDPALTTAFENAKPTLHSYAQAPNSDPGGKKCLGHIDEILRVLARLASQRGD